MSEEYFDVIVIGAGPGGLQASYELKERKINHVVLEKEQNTSSTFSRFPIHRKLISISKKYNFFPEEDFNLRHDWNSLLSRPTELKEGQKKMLMTDWTDELFPSADVLFEYLNEYATRFELPIRHSVEVTSVKKEKSSSSSSSSSEDSHFLIQTSSGSLYRTPLLLCGTGAVAPYIPNIPGIEEAEQYIDHNPDPSRYINKRVLIVGGGNSGFETADFLAGHAAIIHVALRRPVRHAWDSHFVGDLRAVNNNLLDMYQLKSLHATIGDPPQSIEKTKMGHSQ